MLFPFPSVENCWSIGLPSKKPLLEVYWSPLRKNRSRFAQNKEKIAAVPAPTLLCI